MKRIRHLGFPILFILFGFKVLIAQVPADQEEFTPFQIPENFIPCDTKIVNPNEASYIVKTTEGKSYAQIMAEHNTSSANPFDCEKRPFRWLIAFDQDLLINNDTDYIMTVIIEQSIDRMIETFNNSGIEHDGITFWIMPWEVPTYTSIFDIINMLDISDDGQLDNLMSLKNDSLDADLLHVVTVPAAIGKGVNLQNNSMFINHLQNIGVVNFQTVEVGGNTFCHEAGHGLGCGHDTSGNGIDDDARAFVNLDLSVYMHTHLRATNIISAEANAFSGPDSYDINYLDDTIHLWDGYRNNAYYAQLILNAFWCDNIVTQAKILPITCGIGTLVAETNNANQFNWYIIDGDAELSSTSGSEVSIIAHTESTVMLIAKFDGNAYADTSYTIVPAIEIINQPPQEVCEGEVYLLDNGEVAQEGLNIFYMQNDSCDAEFQLELIVHSTDTFDLGSIEICQDESYTLDNGAMAVEGLNVYNLINDKGCEDEYQLNLIINDHTHVSADTTLLDGQPLYGYEVNDGDIIDIPFPGQGEYGCNLTITYTVSIITSALILNDLPNVVLYPNPTNGVFIIEGIEGAQLSISNSLGQIVRQQKLTAPEIDISEIPNGVYTLSISKNEVNVKMKVVKE